MFKAALKAPESKIPKQEPKAKIPKTDEPEEKGLSAVNKRLDDLEMETAQNTKMIQSLQTWSCATWLFEKDTNTAKVLMQYMEEWKEQLKEGEAHPHGPARISVCAAVVDIVEQEYASHTHPTPTFNELLRSAMQGERLDLFLVLVDDTEA